MTHEAPKKNIPNGTASAYPVSSSDPETLGENERQRPESASCRHDSSLTNFCDHDKHAALWRWYHSPRVFYCAHTLTDVVQLYGVARRQSSGAEERSPPSLDGLLPSQSCHSTLWWMVGNMRSEIRPFPPVQRDWISVSARRMASGIPIPMKTCLANIPPLSLPQWFPRLRTTKRQQISRNPQALEPPRRAGWRPVGNDNEKLLRES